MRIKQVKLAQGLPGSASNLIEDSKYHLAFDKGILTAKHKTNPKHGTFMVFPANIAHIELYDEEVTGAAGQEEAQPLTKAKAKK